MDQQGMTLLWIRNCRRQIIHQNARPGLIKAAKETWLEVIRQFITRDQAGKSMSTKHVLNSPGSLIGQLGMLTVHPCQKRVVARGERGFAEVVAPKLNQSRLAETGSKQQIDLLPSRLAPMPVHYIRPGQGTDHFPTPTDSAPKARDVVQLSAPIHG